MQKRKVYLVVFFIFVLAFFAGNLSYPKYFNQGVDFLNTKFSLKLPHFWTKDFKLGLDLQGGTHLIYEADLSSVESKDYSSIMAGLRDIMERRVNYFGVSEPVVQTQEAGGKYRLIIELAGIIDPAQAIQEIGRTPFLEFKEQKENFEEIQQKNTEILEKIQKGEASFEELEEPFQSTELTGRFLKKAEINFDQTTNKPEVSLEFNEEGAKIFEELTARNVGKLIAIYIDGQLIEAPVVQEKISGGKAQITGNFTLETARDLAQNLNAGALPVPIVLISQQSVGPTLGAISLEKSLRAGFFGFLAIILFMIIFYRLSGVLASLSLGVYIVLILSLFKLIPVTLTLAGIGGFILSIGMAVDANILIFSRLREELKQGKDFPQALDEGFHRAWPSIRDGNLTTLIVAAIFFGLGTSFIRGFALTLSIGILVSMFSAIIITKYFLKSFVGTKLEKLKWLW